MMLKGKGALVTGSSNGLGLAMARALAGAGANIVLHGLEAPQRMMQTTDELAHAFDVEVGYVQADLSTPAGVDALVDAARERVKSLDDADQQRGGPSLRVDRRVSVRALEQRAGGESDGRVSRDSTCAARHARAWLGAHLQHDVGVRRARGCQSRRLS